MMTTSGKIAVRKIAREDLFEVGAMAGELVRWHHSLDERRFVIVDGVEKAYVRFYESQLDVPDVVLLVAPMDEKRVGAHLELGDWHAPQGGPYTCKLIPGLSQAPKCVISAEAETLHVPTASLFECLVMFLHFFEFGLVLGAWFFLVILQALNPFSKWRMRPKEMPKVRIVIIFITKESALGSMSGELMAAIPYEKILARRIKTIGCEFIRALKTHSGSISQPRKSNST